MNTALFKGKLENTNSWIYGQYTDSNVHCTDFPCIHPLKIFNDDGEWNISPITLCQFTELFDKKQNKIFEHDLVQMGASKKNIYEIVYKYGAYCLYDKNGEIHKKIGGSNPFYYPIYELFKDKNWEENCVKNLLVVGNYFDKNI